MKTIRTVLFGALAAALIAGCGSGGGEREFDADVVPATTAVDAPEALQVRIGTGNEITKVEGSDPEAAPVFNEAAYGIIVTDADGNPVNAVTLKSAVFSQSYRTGTWSWGGTQWLQNIVATCEGEDANENLLLDANEDKNGDSQLTPGNVAAAFFGTTGESVIGQTDDKGSAVLRIRYPRDRNAWVQVKIQVTASIPNGTESVENRAFWLPVLSDDVTDPLVAPPGSLSPYGAGLCP